MKNLYLILIILSFSATAQRMKLLSGSLKDLKGQTSYDVQFKYDGMLVGRGIPEKTYLDGLKTRWEEKEPGKGKGSSLVNKWFDDRKVRYEPAFIKNFEQYSKVKLNDKNAKYTLLLKTMITEGGWDIGIEGGGGIIAGELWIVESADSNKVVTKINFYDSRGIDKNGGDFEMTTRIKSAYAITGKWLGIFYRKKSK